MPGKHLRKRYRQGIMRHLMMMMDNWKGRQVVQLVERTLGEGAS